MSLLNKEIETIEALKKLSSHATIIIICLGLLAHFIFQVYPALKAIPQIANATSKIVQNDVVSHRLDLINCRALQAIAQQLSKNYKFDPEKCDQVVVHSSDTGMIVPTIPNEQRH